MSMIFLVSINALLLGGFNQGREDINELRRLGMPEVYVVPATRFPHDEVMLDLAREMEQRAHRIDIEYYIRNQTRR